MDHANYGALAAEDTDSEKDKGGEQTSETKTGLVVRADGMPLPATLGPPEPPPERYNFALPPFAVSDLLALQMAECVRVVRSLADDAVSGRLELHERAQTIHSLTDAVKCSSDLTQAFDVLQNGHRECRPHGMRRT